MASQSRGLPSCARFRRHGSDSRRTGPIAESSIAIRSRVASRTNMSDMLTALRLVDEDDRFDKREDRICLTIKREERPVAGP